jgi:osmotically-inducible protein OsmY
LRQINELWDRMKLPILPTDGNEKENMMTDKTLRQTIVDELDFEPSVDAASIGVAVDNGVVTLSGHVTSYAEKIAAERAVERVTGVKAIAENIEVRYPGHKQTADDEIAERAVAILGWNVQVPKDSVDVKVEKGWIELTGDVHWQYQRVAAESAVRELSGVVGVSNLIQVRPMVAARDVKQKILDALKRHAELESDAIRVDVMDGEVVLKGNVKAWYERGIAEHAAWSAPGVKSVQDHLASCTALIEFRLTLGPWCEIAALVSSSANCDRRRRRRNLI